jgi:hypothetical protein
VPLSIYEASGSAMAGLAALLGNHRPKRRLRLEALAGRLRQQMHLALPYLGTLRVLGCMVVDDAALLTRKKIRAWR